jgi:peroxiredoxin
MTIRFALLVLAAGVAWGQSPFSEVPPPKEDGLRFGAELPAFEVKDTAGKTWTLADLRGKYTVLYLWHTFTAKRIDELDPRRKELYRRHLVDLDEVERVHREVKGSKSIQVLTLCTDYDYTHAPEYMKESGHTFPVIADWVLIKKLVPAGGVYWVVNPEGRLSEPFRSWSFSRVFWEVQRAAAR